MTTQELEKIDSDKMKLSFKLYNKNPLFVVELLEVVDKNIQKFFFYIILFLPSLHHRKIFEGSSTRLAQSVHLTRIANTCK